MSALRTHAARKTASFTPRVAAYSSASYSSVCHQEEGGLLPEIKKESSEGRCTMTFPLISSDNDHFESSGGHVRV